jgi:hypothetical protein
MLAFLHLNAWQPFPLVRHFGNMPVDNVASQINGAQMRAGRKESGQTRAD